MVCGSFGSLRPGDPPFFHGRPAGAPVRKAGFWTARGGDHADRGDFRPLCGAMERPPPGTGARAASAWLGGLEFQEQTSAGQEASACRPVSGCRDDGRHAQAAALPRLVGDRQRFYPL